MKQFLKKLLPSSFRLQLRILFRLLKDGLNGNHFRFAKAQHISSNGLAVQMRLSQPIRQNAYSSNKIQNLQIALQSFENVLILPQKIFSFWHFVPAPTVKNGYLSGRNLLGNQLSLDIGGGLCQLSGLLYHLSLQAGLKIVERHAHSLDIYTEENRYTPLGSDATVVYGHKDLRFQNTLPFPIYFTFQLQSDTIEVRLHAAEKIKICSIEFEMNQCEGKAFHKKVKVHRTKQGNRELVSEDVYALLEELR